MRYCTLVSTNPPTHLVHQQDLEAETKLQSWIPRKPTQSSADIRSREGDIRYSTAPNIGTLEHIQNDFDSEVVASKLDMCHTPRASLVAARAGQDMYSHTLGHFGRWLHRHPGEYHDSAKDIRPSQDQAHPWQDTLSTDRYLNVARILLTALESSAAVCHAKGVNGRQCTRKSRDVPERARTRETRDRLALHGRHWALKMRWGEMSRE